MSTRKGHDLPRKAITYVFLALAAFLSLFPFYFMFVSATHSTAEILSITPHLGVGGSLMENWVNLSRKMDVLRVCWNSLVMAGSYTLLTMLFHSMAGYALTKYSFKGKNLMFAVIMLTMMIPGQVLYVPLFTMISGMGWANTYSSVVLPTLANAFGIFLMRQNMLAFPNALIEAARIDGYGEISIFFRIVLPNMKPALGAYWSSDWLTHGCGLGAAQCRPSGLILCYPLLICQGGAREQLCNAALLGSGAADPGQIARISLERHVGPDFPPCFLWQGALDEDIPLQNTLRFALALEAAGRPFALRIYQTAAHGLALATEETREADGSGVCAEARRWPQEAAEWMRLSRPWGAP